jgi:hypothetical protein
LFGADFAKLTAEIPDLAATIETTVEARLPG